MYLCIIKSPKSKPTMATTSNTDKLIKNLNWVSPNLGEGHSNLGGNYWIESTNKPNDPQRYTAYFYNRTFVNLGEFETLEEAQHICQEDYIKRMIEILQEILSDDAWVAVSSMY